jgi:hypothetical protein
MRLPRNQVTGALEHIELVRIERGFRCRRCGCSLQGPVEDSWRKEGGARNAWLAIRCSSYTCLNLNPVWKLFSDVGYGADCSELKNEVELRRHYGVYEAEYILQNPGLPLNRLLSAPPQFRLLN